jgi:hypothetical protein
MLKEASVTASVTASVSYSKGERRWRLTEATVLAVAVVVVKLSSKAIEASSPGTCDTF